MAGKNDMHKLSTAGRLDSRPGDNVTTGPIGLLDQEHALFLDVCAAFERVADGLPDEADFDLARSAADILLRTLPGHIDDESAVLFPCLRACVGSGHLITSVLDELDAQRLQDADMLTELADVLQSDIEGKRARNPAMLGYMLRNYFNSERRQIAWERRIVLPAARMLLSEQDLSRLDSRLQLSGRFSLGSDARLTVRQAITPSGACWACNTPTKN